MGVLRQFKVIFDYSRQQLIIEPYAASGSEGQGNGFGELERYFITKSSAV